MTGGADSTDVKVLAASTEVPILAPAAAERVVVAFPTPALAPGQKLAVTFVEKDGGRRVILEGLAP